MNPIRCCIGPLAGRFNRAYQQYINESDEGDNGNDRKRDEIATGGCFQLAGQDSAEHAADAVDAHNDPEDFAKCLLAEAFDTNKLDHRKGTAITESEHDREYG